jgi:hypothetical protein
MSVIVIGGAVLDVQASETRTVSHTCSSESTVAAAACNSGELSTSLPAPTAGTAR